MSGLCDIMRYNEFGLIRLMFILIAAFDKIRLIIALKKNDNLIPKGNGKL